MRRIVFIVYPGFQLLDLAGAAAVFSGAVAKGAPLYQVISASISGGSVLSGSGIAIATNAIGQTAFDTGDTVIVPGASQDVLRGAMADGELVGALQAASNAAGRVAGVSTGSFLLAASGLLDGKQAATHWASTSDFAAAFPRVTLLRDPVFVEDGGIWTSAGTTTGIDMALDMVKRDHGNAPAHDIARLLRGRRARARLREQD
jgi:transcriptional regulator GlxA family with amidase domain